MSGPVMWGLTAPMLTLVFFSAIGGLLFGYDTGVVSGAMLLVREEFELSTLWHELIVSGTIAAAWVSAVVAGPIADAIGRRRVVLLASALFAMGAVCMSASPNKEVLLTGRIVVGVGIGLASMIVPVYLSETADPAARGRLTVTNTLFVTGGQFGASLICGALAQVDEGWRWMFGLAGVPAVVQFIGFIFMPESPRYLVFHGRKDEARKVLLRYRTHESLIEEELTEIENSAIQDKESSVSWGALVSTATVRRALVLGCLLQLFQQLSGINTVMYYSASIITMAGVSDPITAIWLSAAVSSCNFAFTFVGLYLVERVGRRPLLLWSLAGSVLCLLVLAVSFQVAFLNSPAVDTTDTASVCGAYTSCSGCTFSPDCGFCFSDAGNSSTCLLSDADKYNEASISGDCQEPSVDDFQFAYDWCPSQYAWLSVLGLALYLICFAPGMGTMPWTINSEIYPGWARARCVGITTSVNWMFNLLVSLTFLSLTQTINKHGTFYLYACLAFAGLAVLYWILPETKGTTLENVQRIFQRPLFSTRPRRTPPSNVMEIH